MTLIRLIIFIAISYCCCLLINCAPGIGNGPEASSSTSGNANSPSAESLQAEMESLAKLVFMTPDVFERDRPQLLETDEVKPLLDRFAGLQERFIAIQPAINNQEQFHWTKPTSRFLVKAMREFVARAEEEDVERIVSTCDSLMVMKNIKGTSLLMARRLPILSKFTKENYGKIVEKCLDLLKARFKLFLTLLNDMQNYYGPDFGNLLVSSMKKLKMFSPELDEELKQMAFTEAAARFAENLFDGPEKVKRGANTSEYEFKNQFIDQARYAINTICENIQENVKRTNFDKVNILYNIESDQFELLENFDEFKHWLAVATICHYWPHKINPQMLYNAHVSFHMDLDNLKHLKSHHDALFSPSASLISDANKIESRLKRLRDDFSLRALHQNHMFKLNVNELDILLGFKNQLIISESEIESQDLTVKENGGDNDLMQQIDEIIEYYGSIGAHNIVFYLNSLINKKTGDILADVETILRAGNQQLAQSPQINANLRRLRHFLPGSNDIMAELKTSNLLTGLTDYFLNNLQHLLQMSDFRDHQSRKDFITDWFNQFMDDNCAKYKHAFDGIMPVHMNLGSDKSLNRLNDELKLTLFNIILCNNMDKTILNHIDMLTRLISSRVDGGGPSDENGLK